MNKQNIIKYLEKIAKSAIKDGEHTTALNALKLLGIEKGLFSNKSQKNINITSLSDEDLDHLLSRLEPEQI